MWGVIHGLRSFVPGMLASATACHVVNTASIAGLLPTPHVAAYCTSKFAVVGLSEVLAQEVAQVPGADVGVSVLCPGAVATDIYRTEVARLVAAPAGPPLDDATAQRFAALADPARPDLVDPPAIAGHVVDAIRENRFWVLPTGPDFTALVQARLARIADALPAGPS